MKIQAVMMMKDDVRRMQFVLDNFTKWNPDVPVTVYNCGGKSPTEEVKKYSNVTLVEYADIWQRNTSTGGSFNIEWFKILFKHGLDENFTHLLFLETDVFTTKKITAVPKYDMSGILNPCGSAEHILFEKLNLKVEPHSGCGSTIYRREFFEKTIDKFSFIEDMYKKYPSACFSDLLMTVFARYHGCSVGSWDDATQDGYFYLNEDGSLSEVKSRNPYAALVHNIKV